MTDLDTMDTSCSLSLNLPEFAALVEYVRLPAPNLLSPLPDLCSPRSKGTPRPVEQVVAPLRGLPDETIRNALLPLALPDRILDVHAALFNSTPSLTRLYASLQAGDHFVSLRRGTGFDRELAFPFSRADVVAWLYLQMQFASPFTLPAPQAEFTAEGLAFFLAAVDASKTAFAGSFTSRRPEPEPVTVTVDDIVAAQEAARQSRDRRWITAAMEEVLGAMVHIGGRDGVHLPVLTRELAGREVQRCVEEGHIQPATGKAAGRYELGLRWAQAAGDLFTWLSLISIHDLQITGGSVAGPEAWEEMLAFVCTSNTVWVLASGGLGASQGDLGGVRFGLTSCGMHAALEVASEFLKPWPGVELAAGFYAPPAGAEAALRQGAPAGPELHPGGSGVGRPRECPSCGVPVQAGKAFCGQCGTKLGPDRPGPSGKCPTCGASAEPGQRFCRGCGAPLAPPPGRGRR